MVVEHHSQWNQILPQEEFSYNDSSNRSTGRIPLYIVYGMQPRGVSEMRDFKHNEFRIASAEDSTVGNAGAPHQNKGMIEKFKSEIQVQSRSTHKRTSI
jgi:hypothetical protein